MKRPASPSLSISKKPAGRQSTLPDVAPGKVPVFVMMQLDWMADDAQSLRNRAALYAQLKALKGSGITGVMADVWWGLCEAEPHNYRFGAVVELCDVLLEVGLQLQAVMSFHQCGGNVGDSVNIPLPFWALSIAKENGLLYCSNTGIVSEDCLSLSADKQEVFPNPGGNRSINRTGLDCYRDYIAAFLRAVKHRLGTVVCELQVGMGPCGELRYPSYMMSNGWKWPGVGLVTASDPHMKLRMQQEAKLLKLPEGLPEDQNALPDEIPIFKDARKSEPGFRSAEGKRFFSWYSACLIDHGRNVLLATVEALKQIDISTESSGLCLSVKISGLHWHVTHRSRATEACAGYDCCSDVASDAYGDIAKMLSGISEIISLPVLFNFTCMEMQNNSSAGVPESLSAPEDLIAQVRKACLTYNVPLAGENALEFDPSTGQWAFDQMTKQVRSWSNGGDCMHGLTLLRLGEAFVKQDSLEKLGQFASRL